MSVFGLRFNAARCRVSVFRTCRVRYNSAVANGLPDLRKQIMDEIKVAMRNKDSVASTTLRSVLSDVYNADKATSQGDKINSSAIVGILRKAVERRSEAAESFKAASRDDLAEKELKQVEIISKFLPPTLPESEIDAILSSVISQLPATDGPHPPKALGLVFKNFYAQVDKSLVDSDLVKKRAQVLLNSQKS